MPGLQACHATPSSLFPLYVDGFWRSDSGPCAWIKKSTLSPEPSPQPRTLIFTVKLTLSWPEGWANALFALWSSTGNQERKQWPCPWPPDMDEHEGPEWHHDNHLWDTSLLSAMLAQFSTWISLQGWYYYLNVPKRKQAQRSWTTCLRFLYTMCANQTQMDHWVASLT